MNYGRKPCDIQSRRNQYMQHIKKLQEVKNGRTPFHRSLGRQRKNIDDLLKVSHQIHNISIREEFKKRELTQLQCQRKSYDCIRSIIKSQLNRKILAVPSKHKPDTYFIDRANLTLINRIVNVKSQFNFKKQTLQKMATMRPRNQTHEDYSKFYHETFCKIERSNKIYLRMGKAKLNNKIIFHFLNNQHLECFRKDGNFVIQLQCSSKKKQSKIYQLNEILKSEIHISFPEDEIVLNFYEKVGQRMLQRFKLSFTEVQMNSVDKIWTSKAIEDTKNRVIGFVELQIKKRKNRISNNMFYDDLAQNEGQKENSNHSLLKPPTT